MKTTITCLILASVLLLSCKHGRKDIMLGKWHGVKLENPEMDSFFNESQHYIDTLGKNNTAETNISLYGTSNVDSIRHELQVQHDSAKAMQTGAVMNTVFDFRNDSIVVISFSGAMDTSKWHLENDQTLIMDEASGAAKGSTTRMEIKGLTKDEMKLEFEEENTRSTVTFARLVK